MVTNILISNNFVPGETEKMVSNIFGDATSQTCHEEVLTEVRDSTRPAYVHSPLCKRGTQCSFPLAEVSSFAPLCSSGQASSTAMCMACPVSFSVWIAAH